MKRFTAERLPLSYYVAFVIAFSACLSMAGNTTSAQEKAIFSLKVGRYRLQSNPWVNLHQRLMYEARFDDAPPVALSGLFYTSSELTRRALAKRGVSNYQPVILGMYDRGYHDFRKSLETHWQAYLDGKASREAAIRQILIETAPQKKQ